LTLSFVTLGEEVSDLTEEVSRKSGLEALLVSRPECRDYTPEVYCEILSQIIQRESPYLVLVGHTYQTLDYAPKLAAMLRRAYVPNCIDCHLDKGQLIFVRRIFGSRVCQHVGVKGPPPYLVTLQPGAFDALDPTSEGPSKVFHLDVFPSASIVRRKVLGIISQSDDRVDLSRAEIIVAGGRGLGSKEGFQLVLNLAEAMGAAVGATRPVIDAGWFPRGFQIGSSGQSVSPRLYIACGISGAVQHLVGIMNSRLIVAINKDPNAPIFNVADYGIVGDALKIVPILTELAKAGKSRPDSADSLEVPYEIGRESRR
jgi:electron transfer flavoprotein alpha subunit